ncbi:MAG: cell division inhibitor [Cryomorphaceae bacterium]|nr:MAG: cell division inhibitor [Cryomorphaceae bacterium]
MKIYRLYRKQFLPISMEEAWAFFSNPSNLAKITPPHMGFVIRSGADKTMYAGQLITYTVKPFPGVPLTWVTEITQVNEPHFFIDNQVFGPYSLWHHQHFFKPVEGGIEMEDIVHYKIPLGILGRIAHALFVKRQLKQIFDYRVKVLEERFPK